MPDSGSHDPISMNEQRDRLANMRTILAWVRTSVAVMALGFVVAKFGIVLDELPGHRHALDLRLAAVTGTVLVVTGAVLLLLATTEFLAVDRAISRGKVYFRRTSVLALTLLLTAAAVVLSVYLIITS